jgi:hypothetical protein
VARPAIALVDPVVGRPRQKVRDKEGHAVVAPEGVESWIALNAVEFDEVVGLDKGQDTDLRVAVGSARDESPMPHPSHKPIGRCLVGRIVGACKHLAVRKERDAARRLDQAA